MSDLTAIVAFVAVAVLALALVTYMLYRRALEMEHPRVRVLGRLVVFWLAALLILSAGLYLKHRYPEGLARVGSAGASGGPPVALGGARGTGAAVAAGLALVIGALVAWFAIRPLQNPPAKSATPVGAEAAKTAPAPAEITEEKQ